MGEGRPDKAKDATAVQRRDVLIGAGATLARGLVRAPMGVGLAAPVLAAPALAKTNASPPALGPDHVRFLRRGDRDAARFSSAFRQPREAPELRALCRTPKAVATLVRWARDRGRTFAIRSGGHSFTGGSAHSDLVIDTRPLDSVMYDPADRTLTAGPGAVMTDIVGTLAGTDRAIPVGTCPTVGVAGLALGGGIGFLARHAGMTCDALTSVQMVDANGQLLEIDDGSHPDLFWALRGGGGGSFGIVTDLRFATFPLRRAVWFDLQWAVNPRRGADIVAAWGAWAVSDDHDFGTLLEIRPHFAGSVLVRLQGLAVRPLQAAKRLLGPMIDVALPWAPPVIAEMSLAEAATHMWAVDHNAAGGSKIRSMVTSSPMSDASNLAMCEAVAAPSDTPIVITVEAFGGAVAKVPAQATAFPYRGPRQSVVQITGGERTYGTSPANDPVDQVYEVLSAASDGAGYANYPDADLGNWARAYWGDNLDRLKAVKRRYDPDNLFRHSHSVPLG